MIEFWHKLWSWTNATHIQANFLIVSIASPTLTCFSNVTLGLTVSVRVHIAASFNRSSPTLSGSSDTESSWIGIVWPCAVSKSERISSTYSVLEIVSTCNASTSLSACGSASLSYKKLNLKILYSLSIEFLLYRLGGTGIKCMSLSLQFLLKMPIMNAWSARIAVGYQNWLAQQVSTDITAVFMDVSSTSHTAKHLVFVYIAWKVLTFWKMK